MFHIDNLVYYAEQKSAGRELPKKFAGDDVHQVLRVEEHFVPFSFFYARKHYCFQRVLAIAFLSIRLSVCHTGGSVKNGASYDHQIFTVGCLEDSSFRNRKAFP